VIRPSLAGCPTQRSGATLTEVLMAIFVMSIGVVSVVTLFPLAILRAVHATQLTNSKVLEENIEEFICSNRWMLRCSPVDRQLDPTNATDNSYINSACVIDPLGEQFLPNFSTRFGNQGAAAPGFAIRRISPYQQFTPAPSYLSPPVITAAMAATLNSNWSNTARLSMDQTVCALPDSWVTLADDLPESVTGSAVTFNSNIDMGASSGQVRLTLISQDRTRSVTRMGTAAGQTFTKNTTEPNIPAGFSIANVGRAVIETNESRYSWIITCPAPANAPPAASCAVFFRRSFNAEEEFIYQAASSAAPFTLGSPTVTIEWTANDPVPLLREGNYVFDAENAFWYRIRSYTFDEAARSATIELDREARLAGQGIIIPHGLVHVFDLELRGQE
jgi:hypothetical protein